MNEIKKKEKQHRRASEFRKQRSEILGTVYKNCLTSSQSHSLFMHAHTYTRIKYHIYANMKIFNQILANEERTSALTIRFCVLLLFLSLLFCLFCFIHSSPSSAVHTFHKRHADFERNHQIFSYI